MYDYTTIIEYSSIGLLLVTAALAAARRERYSWIPALLLLLPDLVVPASYLMYPALIDAVAAINVLTLMLVRGSQYKGMDYALVSFMGLMTSYAMYVPLGIGDAYFVLLLGIFMLVSVPVYFIIQLGGTRENLSAAVKAITALVIATVLYFTGASILFFALINQVGGLALLGYTFLILGMMLEVGAAPMHYWVPDAFSAGNPYAVSIIASIAKFVPFIVTLKIVYPLVANMAPLYADVIVWETALLAAFSMTLGNIGAITSREPAKVLAYSTVANMGYAMAALTIFFVHGAGEAALAYALLGLLAQLLVNGAGKIGLFSIIGNERGSRWSYILAYSFIGVPPLLGFWSKLFIILGLIYAGPSLWWLAVLLVINSVISVPYYVRLSKSLSGSGSGGVGLLVVVLASIIMLAGLIIPVPLAMIGSVHSLLAYLLP
ncbi:F420H(2):quinone oxidoreductase [Thermocladium modestius]|uniref:F420H(2):quinone oxidoreductase n=1 Tax=Thermocladium modestius TaxID=62609 RepID=A0A830GR95_9CREN|nr:proton-conducting transporter membrane subunit [Thermocladium modestius]GGP18861.1 F420H(2):quinone oxidoreductase [Thermocladium modestius]